MSSNKHYRQSIAIGIFIGIGFAIAFGIGFITSSFIFPGRSQIDTATTSMPLQILSEVQRLLDNVYLRELPQKSVMEYGAIQGMLETLNDPTTRFIEPPVAQSEAHALAGTYGGIGVQVKRLESGKFALYPFDGSPAYREGLRDDDILVEVDNTVIESDMPIDVVDQMLRGEVVAENGVNIRVARNNQDFVEAFVPFEVINVPSVISRVVNEDDRIGYIQILRFTSRTPEELDDNLAELMNDDISALIIDLRNNGGGLLVESIEVADKFLSEGIIVIEQSRNDREIFSADAELSIGNDISIAVVVNENTASASELVAGALQDNGRGVLLGQKTFGKGTVQQIFPLSDGSSVHITSAEWLTPNEQQIASNGLTPDIVMIPDDNNRDVEFGEAVRYLKTILDKQSK